MKVPEQERRDWIMIPLILGIGFLCVIIAGQWALRFSPSWKLNADMDSNLDPNSDFLTRRPSGFIEPVDPSILTQPVWINLFLTPGAQFSTRAVIPITASPYLTKLTATQTPFSITTSTNTNIAIASPTNTFVYYPPTSQPKPTATSTVSPIYTSTPTAAVTSSWTSTPTPTQSPTGTSTPLSTLTSTATQTPTNTPDPSEPEFGGPDGNTATLGNGAWVEFNLSGFLLDGNSAWDAVYYEMEEASSAGKIHLGAVKIEVYDQTTTAWYEIYNWGDGIADSNFQLIRVCSMVLHH